MEILELKNIVFEIKKSLDIINSRLDRRKRVNEHKDRIIVIQIESQWGRKALKRNSSQRLMDSVK